MSRHHRLQSSTSSSGDPQPRSSPEDARATSAGDESPTRPSSEGYPSWLPRRPQPPQPPSTLHSTAGILDAANEQPEQDPSSSTRPPFFGGRKPTPRSIRIVQLQESYANEEKRREATDQTRVDNTNANAGPRVWSRASGAGFSPAALAGQRPKPKFRTRGLHLELLRSPSMWTKIYFYLWPIIVFAHIPLQTFFDFNAAFVLFQVSKYPNPLPNGAPGSGRNWSLGTAAYVACWGAWLFAVVLVYEIVYSFIRRWRLKRPSILPVYLSSPAYKLAAMRSYDHFCFLLHTRISAFFPASGGSMRDGIAETCWWYSQNVPTVALLLPRAGLCLALLFSFSTPQANSGFFANSAYQLRDGTFFRDNGALTSYARGVLIANAVWTGWRILVLMLSWLGLWVLSEQAFGGLCGPRFRWEEEEAEKRRSYYRQSFHRRTVSGVSDSSVDSQEEIPWSWRECTRERIQDAFEFCMTNRNSALRWSRQKEPSKDSEQPEFTDIDANRILAAVGFPAAPPPARRGVLSGELFSTPSPEDDQLPVDLGDVIPKVVKKNSKEREVVAGTSLLPYPFKGPNAQVASTDRVPFPESPSPPGRRSAGAATVTSKSTTTTSSATKSSSSESEGTGSGSGSGSKSGSGSGSGSGSKSGSGSTEDDSEEEGDEEEEEEEEEEESSSQAGRRTSGSMSSLGHPISSRYPFGFRHPGHYRGGSQSSSGPSHIIPSSYNSSGHRHGHRKSQFSQGTQNTRSTGTHNRESSDSHSPRSLTTSGASQVSASEFGVIPMPPRHPHADQGRGRQRAGTVPSVSSLDSNGGAAIAFPTTSGRPRAYTKGSYGSKPGSEEGDDLVSYPPDVHSVHSLDSHTESQGEEAEREDRVGLLSSSPRHSLRNRPSFTGSAGYRSGSGSNSRSNSHSSSSRSRHNSLAQSISQSVRSRTQSLMQTMNQASHSSIELVQSAIIRSRANSSMARLEEDSPYDSSHSRSASGSGQSSTENYTFGVPLRKGPVALPSRVVEEEPADLQSHSRQGSLRERTMRKSRSFDSTILPASPLSQMFSSPPLAPMTPSSPINVPQSPRSPRTLRSPSAVESEEQTITGTSAGSSPPDISTAAQSFVTAPATITETSESGEHGRLAGGESQSWMAGDLMQMVDRQNMDGRWRPQGPF